MQVAIGTLLLAGPLGTADNKVCVCVCALHTQLSDLLGLCHISKLTNYASVISVATVSTVYSLKVAGSPSSETVRLSCSFLPPVFIATVVKLLWEHLEWAHRGWGGEARVVSVYCSVTSAQCDDFVSGRIDP